MGTLTTTPQWHDNITQLEKGDLVLGGPNGKANEQPKQLAENILFIAKMLADMGITRDGVNINAGLVSTSLNKDTTVRTQQEKNNDIINILDLMTPTELAAYKSDPTTFDATEAFNRAGIFAAMLKRKLVAYGTFYTTKTLVVTSDCDFSQADINTTSSLGIDVRNANDIATPKILSDLNISLPRNLVYTPKSGLGWVISTVGVKLTNLYSNKVIFGRVANFETNVHVYAEETGNAYNDYFIGHLNNGKVNLLLSAGKNGWANENNFFGGRYSHESAEGTNVAGTRHIKIATAEHSINNNVFYKPSIEADIAEYHVENGGCYNTFLSARWEATTPKILYVSDDAAANATNLGTANMVISGYNVDAIVTMNTGTKSAFNNRLIGFSREVNPISSSIGGYRYKNTSSDANAVMTCFSSGADLANIDKSQYTWSLSSNALNAKRSGDTYPRVTLDFVSGKLLMGNGVAAPTAGLIVFGGTEVALSSGNWYPAKTATQSLGEANYRWKQMYLSDGFGVFGATPPATKPTITGSRGGNAVLASLITALASYGLITDNTTA